MSVCLDIFGVAWKFWKLENPLKQKQLRQRHGKYFTLPETNIFAPENRGLDSRPLEKEKTPNLETHHFLGTMLLQVIQSALFIP